MAQITIGTFNVENLLNRFDFYSFGRLRRVPALELLNIGDGAVDMQLRRSLHLTLTDDNRQLTAQAISDLDVDVLAMQEVDNRNVLDTFHRYYLDRGGDNHYGWRRCIDGNDIRGIDVAVMSKYRINVTSHADHTFDDFGLFNDDLREYGLSPGDNIFRRDCLEVEVSWSDNGNLARLTMFVCHFKSMSGGRDATSAVRTAEAEAVKRIINDKYGQNVAQEDWVILGDLNDYAFRNSRQRNNSIETLYDNGFSFNIIENLPMQDRWTHYYSGENSKSQLDYILISPELQRKNPNVQPVIIRNGLPTRVPNTDQISRYGRTGFDRPKASDHCPLAVSLNV